MIAASVGLHVAHWIFPAGYMRRPVKSKIIHFPCGKGQFIKIGYQLTLRCNREIAALSKGNAFNVLNGRTAAYFGKRSLSFTQHYKIKAAFLDGFPGKRRGVNTACNCGASRQDFMRHPCKIGGLME